MTDGRTHYEGCWKEHLDCAQVRIAYLENKRARLARRLLHADDENFRLRKLLTEADDTIVKLNTPATPTGDHQERN